MKTTTTAQNQKTPTRGRDLGQISIKAYRYPDDNQYSPGCWSAWIEGRTDHWVSTMDDGEEKCRANYLAMGMAFLKVTYAAWTLAGLTSQSKLEREAAKADVREWVETGKAVYAALMAAIEQAKADDVAKDSDHG